MRGDGAEVQLGQLSLVCILSRSAVKMRFSRLWLASSALALPSLVAPSPAQADSPLHLVKRPVVVSRHGLAAHDERREQLHDAWAELVRRANHPKVLEKRVSGDLDLSSSLDNKVLFDG